MCGYVICIFWNEPNYEESVERNLLKLLGGDSLNASQKNQSDVNISSCPLIITSNQTIFPNLPEFNVRIKYHYWRSCSLLKSISGKKLHPLLSILDLFDETESYYQEDICSYAKKYNDNSDKEA